MLSQISIVDTELSISSVDIVAGENVVGVEVICFPWVPSVTVTLKLNVVPSAALAGFENVHDPCHNVGVPPFLTKLMLVP